jgi:hypothetical protein
MFSNQPPEPMPGGADGRPVLRGSAFAVDIIGVVAQLFRQAAYNQRHEQKYENETETLINSNKKVAYLGNFCGSPDDGHALPGTHHSRTIFSIHKSTADK